jgi:hypothetical protein
MYIGILTTETPTLEPLAHLANNYALRPLEIDIELPNFAVGKI